MIIHLSNQKRHLQITNKFLIIYSLVAFQIYEEDTPSSNRNIFFYNVVSCYLTIIK